jgi:hypothetical protein
MGMAMIGTKINQTLLAFNYISKLIIQIQYDILFSPLELMKLKIVLDVYHILRLNLGY